MSQLKLYGWTECNEAACSISRYVLDVFRLPTDSDFDDTGRLSRQWELYPWELERDDSDAHFYRTFGEAQKALIRHLNEEIKIRKELLLRVRKSKVKGL